MVRYVGASSSGRYLGYTSFLFAPAILLRDQQLLRRGQKQSLESVLPAPCNPVRTYRKIEEKGEIFTPYPPHALRLMYRASRENVGKLDVGKGCFLGKEISSSLFLSSSFTKDHQQSTSRQHNDSLVIVRAYSFFL